MENILELFDTNIDKIKDFLGSSVRWLFEGLTDSLIIIGLSESIASSISFLVVFF